MSNNFKISKRRLAEIIQEEYALIREEVKSAEVSEKKIENDSQFSLGRCMAFVSMMPIPMPSQQIIYEYNIRTNGLLRFT